MLLLERLTLRPNSSIQSNFRAPRHHIVPSYPLFVKTQKKLAKILCTNKPLGNPHPQPGKNVDALVAFRHEPRSTLNFHPPTSTTMKKKSTSRSAFFNLRVLIGLFMRPGRRLFWRWQALARSRQSSRKLRTSAEQRDTKIINIQVLPPGFDCSTIHEMGIDRMESLQGD